MKLRTYLAKLDDAEAKARMSKVMINHPPVAKKDKRKHPRPFEAAKKRKTT